VLGGDEAQTKASFYVGTGFGRPVTRVHNSFIDETTRKQPEGDFVSLVNTIYGSILVRRGAGGGGVIFKSRMSNIENIYNEC